MNQSITDGSFSTFKRRVIWLAPRLLILVLVLVVVNIAATIFLGKKLEHKLDAIGAKGEPVSVSDLGRPRVSYAENAAINYQEAFQVIDYGSAKSDLITIQDFLKADNRNNNPAIRGEAESAVQRLQPIIPIVEKAVKRPKCQFPVNWEAGPGATFPHFSKMRYISQILYATALVEAKQGRMDQALHLMELELKTSQALSDEPVMIGLRVRISILNMGTKSLREIVNTGKISETQARRMSDLLAEIDLYPGLLKAVEGERAMGLWWYGSTPTSEFYSAIMYGTDTTKGKIFGHLIKSQAWKPFLYLDEMAYLDAMDNQIQKIKLSSLELRHNDFKYDPWTDGPSYAFITKGVYMYLTTRKTLDRDEGIAELSGSRILLGLIAYKDRFGSYPAALEELKTKLGWEVPKDPFSEKDFIYKREGKGFLLYSVGKNFRDDGAKLVKGMLSDGSLYPARDRLYSGDIIWQMDH